MSQELKERNKEIYNDSKIMSMVDLVAKYRRNSSVLWKIIKREKGKEAK
jgi:Mor family transcriptional regulator